MIPKYRIGIINAAVIFAGEEPDIEPRLKLLRILEPLSEEVIWVNTNCPDIEQRLPPKATVLNIDFPYYMKPREGKGPFLPRLFFFLRYQLKIIFALFKLRKVDILFFAFGTDLFVFPMLLGKLLRKGIILRSDGRPSTALEIYREKSTKSKIALFKIVEKASYLLADKLLAESVYYFVNVCNLRGYQYKIADGSLYVDASFFKRNKKLTERTYKIGYIGRFSREKGVIEFAQSLSSLLQEEQAQAIMIGDGDLGDDIKKILIKGDIQNKIKMTGWIQHGELPEYLSNIKIIVVPSYWEGLPNLVLEAMGCGCIVVATPVGGIPGVVKDGETGFIMENNSPNCIAKNIIRALNHPNLEKIADNARTLIEKEYTYEATVEKYRNTLASLRR